MEKLPQDYNQGKLQKIIEYLESKVSRTEKRSERNFHDLSEEFTERLTSTEKKLTDKIVGKDEMGKPPRTIPVPQDLLVKGSLFLVFCSVKPFTFWKHLFTGIKGYEFYGSYNPTFSVQEDDYTQTGVHYGSSASSFLYTKDITDSTHNFVIDPRVVKLIASKRLTLENVTQSKSGTITTSSYTSAYKLTVSGVTWNVGDVWRIRNYPTNRLYSIGPFALVVKTFKTMKLDFYIKARTVGTGMTYSEFVSSDTTQGVETMPAPTSLNAIQKDIPKWMTPLQVNRHVYWVQDIPYVDILLTWDNLDSEYGLVEYEIKENEEEIN